MKRSIPADFNNQNTFNNNNNNKRTIDKYQNTIKKIKQSKHDPSPSNATATSAAAVFTDENLLYEVLKHVDAQTLGVSACVSKHWHQTAQDERLWELICTWSNSGCGDDQLRTVVLALGGFRCLHSRYLMRLSKPSVSVATLSSSYTVATAMAWPCQPPPQPPPPPPPLRTALAAKTRWGKDEIQLSLSLLSVHYFGKLNYSNRNK